MSVLQVWLIVGVPLVVAAVVLLIGGAPQRARAAVGLLAALAVTLAVVPEGGGASIAVLALPITVLVASGRLEGERRPRHHETRASMTRAGAL